MNMTCEIADIISSLFTTLLGGILAIIGSIVAQHYQWKKEKSLWLNEKRLDLYADLISLLDSIEIRVQSNYDKNLSVVELKTEVEYVKTKLAELLQFMECNNGKLLLFLPKGVNTDLIKLSGAIYAITSDERKQIIDLANIENSEIYKVVKHAMEISEELKNELNK